MQELYNILEKISGKFLLSYSDNDEVKIIFKKYKIIKVKTHYEFSRKYINEILIMNY